MRKPNSLKRRLKDGEIVFGPWCVVQSPSMINIIGAAGMDFVIIDMEHGPAGFETAEDMARAAESENCCPLIRVGQRNESTVLRALDIGTHGLLMPHVESREDAEESVSFSKYYPEGTRGFSPYTRAGGYGYLGVKDHAQKENEETLIGIILEGNAGINNIDSILETKNIDLIYIGAYDLSQAMGMPGQVEHPDIKKEMERCILKIRDSGIAAGGYVAKNTDDIKWMTDIGMQFITCLPDATMIFHAFYDCVREFKKVLCEEEKTQ
ncbi:MAG: aldolase/citrate lyase family protein [Candidatus Electryoneaceae bacterium]|nr:aldolase/citrate lyase family protein [Candidatus Electryoneaceae bacterium]